MTSPSGTSPSGTPSSATPTGHRRNRPSTALALVLVLALAAAGCGLGNRTTTASPAATAAQPGGTVHVPVGSSTQHLTVDAHDREFRVYRPTSLPSASVPLVVMIHGGYGSAANAESDYGWDPQADRSGFVVAYPQGLNKAWNGGGGCCGQPGRTDIDDVAFISQMVATISRELPIDPARVYATGISNGGIMSYRLACDTTLFAAIGPDSATMTGSCPNPAPVSVIHIHGLADDRIPFDGGKGTAKFPPTVVDGPSVPSVIAQWRATDDCAAPTTTASGPVTTSTSDCPSGRAVELITIAGAGHQWPGGKPKSALARAMGTSEPSTALDATSTIWAFFAAHPKN